ncbi:MAG: dihydropteroate synthase [Thermosediminibacterales bacterium]|nr:dihydropteroate synthase [Thermosediminibacterales bacterium]MDK2836122.1 dihydropteroate synthase [Thermosediminibacterales bacterium]
MPALQVLYADNLKEIKEEIRKIKPDASSISIMAPKGVFRLIKITDVSTKAANIIKQEMLSKGGEAAVSRSVLDFSSEKTDILLMGNLKQYERLLYKLKIQPFGLKEIADEIEKLLNNLEGEKTQVLKLGKHTLPLGEKTYIMGILNITPDSFSDGGKYNNREKAIQRAVEMVKQGADIIDVGAESSRPGSTPISLEEELNRLVPVLEPLIKTVDVPISVDTYKSETAERALQMGAHIINDIWGLKADPKMGQVISKYNGAVILMHNKDDFYYKDLMGDIISSLKESIEKAERAGINHGNIIIDPGIGFGKTTEQNLEVMRNLRQLKGLGKPILLGTSRKSMIGNTLDLPVDERLEGTAATVALGISQGIDIVRVHDVREMARVVRMTDAIVRP